MRKRHRFDDAVIGSDFAVDSKEQKRADRFRERKKRQATEQTTTIKMGFRAFCRDERIGAFIQDAVNAMTQMYIEAGKLLNLHLTWIMTRRGAVKDRSVIDIPNLQANQSLVEYAFQLVSTLKGSRGEYNVKREAKIDDRTEHALLRETYETLYLQVRPDNLQFPSRDYIGQMIKYARVAWQTAAKNSVTTNFRRRHRQFILSYVATCLPSLTLRKQQWPVVDRIYRESISEQDAKYPPACKTFEDLMPGNVGGQAWCRKFASDMRAFLAQDGLIPVTKVSLSRDWWKYLRWFAVIRCRMEVVNVRVAESKDEQQRRANRGNRTFTLLPEFKLHSKYVTIDTTVLKSLYKAAYTGNEKVTSNDADELWSRAFHVAKLRRHNKASGYKFGNILSTDGVAVSVNLRRTAVVSASAAEEDGDLLPDDSKLADRSFEPVDIGDDVKVVGLDPGRGDLFVAVDNQEHKRVTRCSTRQYHSEAGFAKRQRDTRRALESKANRQMHAALLAIPSPKVSAVDAYLEHLKHVLKNLGSFLEFHGRRKRRRGRRRVHIQKHKALDKLCKRITGGDRHTVVAFGDGSFSSSSRGHAAGPVKTLRKRLRMHCHVIDVDEFRTSRICARCSHAEPTKGHVGYDGSKESYKVRVCQNPECRIVWNRDVNAAENILKLFLHMNEHGGSGRPDVFARSSSG